MMMRTLHLQPHLQAKSPELKIHFQRKRKKQNPSKKPQEAATERLPLDEKLYQRDLEVALALSVQDASVEVHASPSNKTCTNAESNDVDHVPLLSNCSVDSDLLELDKITDVKDNEPGNRCRRVAASKAITGQRKMLIDDSDGEEKCEEYKPDLDSEFESDSNSSDGEDVSDDEDVEFKSALKKCKKSKDMKKKETKLKVSSEKEKKTPKSRFTSTVTVTATSSTSATKMKSLPMLKTSVSPKPVGSPIKENSPPVARKPSWTPPSASGNSNATLGGTSVKSPNQGLRLGLSRFARVKPLHPSVGSS